MKYDWLIDWLAFNRYKEECFKQPTAMPTSVSPAWLPRYTMCMGVLALRSVLRHLLLFSGALLWVSLPLYKLRCVLSHSSDGWTVVKQMSRTRKYLLECEALNLSVPIRLNSLNILKSSRGDCALASDLLVRLFGDDHGAALQHCAWFRRSVECCALMCSSVTRLPASTASILTGQHSPVFCSQFDAVKPRS